MDKKTAFSLILTSILAVSGAAQQTSSFQDLGAASGVGAGEIHAALQQAKTAHAQPRELFEIRESTGKPQLVIREDQLGKSYLFSATLDKGTGERGIYSSVPEDTFLFSLIKAGDKIQLLRKNTDARAKPGTPEAKAVERSFPDSILAVAKITEQDEKTKTVSISAEDLILDDLLDFAGRLRATYKDAPHELQYNPQNSRVVSLAAFPKNMEVKVQLLFNRQKSGGSSTLMDARTIPITLHYSISTLPENSTYQERESDSRVGYFTTSFKDFTKPELKDKAEPIVTLINRWNLEKSDPNAAVSDVKNPIVLWLDDAIPQDYRPAMKAGLLAWNHAFEAIGLRNAVVVKEVDKDMSAEERKSFDPSNASYNMVRWFMAEDAGFALGPSRANPITGEIYSASIHFSDVMTRFVTNGMLELDAKPAAAHVHSGQCRHNEAMAEKVRLAAANLAMLEREAPLSQVERKRYMDEFLTEVTAHEAGHILGLRHNFKGSNMLPLEELGKDGWLSSSVMDYLPANPNPNKWAGKPYFQTKIGPYDYWAVEYGYKTGVNKDQLKAIAERSEKDPLLAYGTDEDVNGFDPDTQRFDQGKGGPLPYAKSRVNAARELWKKLETRTASTEKERAALTDSFTAGLGEYFGAVNAVLPVVGGVRSYRARPNQPGAAPLEVVSGAEQREALNFLTESVLSADPFKISPQLMSRLTSESKPYQGSEPLAVAASIQGLQKSVLLKLHSPDTLNRLVTSELYTGGGASHMSVGEVLSTVRQSVWKEIRTATPTSIHLYRRNLQRNHVDFLVKTLDGKNVPNDAKASARQNLIVLYRDLDAASKRQGLDETTKNHILEMRELVDRKINIMLKVTAPRD